MANEHEILSITDDSGVRKVATVQFRVDGLPVGQRIQAFPNTYSNDDIVAEVNQVAEVFFAERETGLAVETESVVEEWNHQLIEGE